MREEALKWWKPLTDDEKRSLVETHMTPETQRDHKYLTGLEIENIYKKVNNVTE